MRLVPIFTPFPMLVNSINSFGERKNQKSTVCAFVGLQRVEATVDFLFVPFYYRFSSC